MDPLVGVTRGRIPLAGQYFDIHKNFVDENIIFQILTDIC
jgi:hypothetical protein